MVVQCINYHSVPLFFVGVKLLGGRRILPLLTRPVQQGKELIVKLILK
ncbi:MAG: hypothetical protein JG782_1832 [Anaerophaga sp.]|nr:hypothetical protein [Anaerophaga sp.]